MQNSRYLRTLRDIPSKNLKNQRVLVRADFNVPLGKDGMISDDEDWRIKAALPTIKYLLANNSKIILLAHLGRPKGKKAEKLRLGPVQDKLSELLDLSIKKMPDCIGKKTEKAIDEMEAGEIMLLENLRFHAGEEKNDNNFSKSLARLGDIYVNDAFSDCHRNHASIAGITKFLPSYAGLSLEKEIQTMKKFYDPVHPAIAIIGGAKLETKLPAVSNLAGIYDRVLVGGMIANEILQTSAAKKISPNVILPLPDSLLGQKYFDIGENSVREFSVFLKTAKTIIWNGPMGKFEDSRYQAGTKGVIELIKSAHKNGANVLIGGGETICAVQKFAPELMDKKLKNFNISAGGGAMLEYLAGKKLPGIEALNK